MPYRIAGIDVHKKMLAVVVADVEIDGDFHFDRQKVGTTPADLRGLADWLIEQDVEEVVMESTARYWRPVWEALEQHWRPQRRARDAAPRLAGTLHLAQAQSNRGPGGRKRDFPDAERLVKRLVAQELTLSFVPDTEQRLWRTVMRRKYQITRNRVQLHNRLESLLEEAHIKVSSIVSDLLGISARRMLQALAEDETDPAALTKLAASRLRATPEQLCDAFQACPTLHPVYRRLLKLTLEELRVIEDRLGQLDQQMADLLAAHHDAVQRLAEVPGLGVDSAQQIIAEVGATAATFPSPKHLASWMGACPGNEESAGVNYSHLAPVCRRISDKMSTFEVSEICLQTSDVPAGERSPRRRIGDAAGWRIRWVRPCETAGCCRGRRRLSTARTDSASASVKLQELFGLAENARGPTAPGADSLSSARAQREDRRADDARSAELLGDDISRRAKELRAAIPSTPGRTTRAGAGDPSDNEETLKRRSAPQRKRDGWERACSCGSMRSRTCGLWHVNARLPDCPIGPRSRG